MGSTGLDRSAPGLFGHANRRFFTPDYAFVLMGVLATALTVVNYTFFATKESVFWSIFALSSIVFLLPYLLMFPSVIMLRTKQPDTPRSYTAPGHRPGVWLSVVFTMAGVMLAIVLFFHLVRTGTHKVTYWIVTGGGTVLSMLVGWWLARRAESRDSLPRGSEVDLCGTGRALSTNGRQSSNHGGAPPKRKRVGRQPTVRVRPGAALPAFLGALDQGRAISLPHDRTRGLRTDGTLEHARHVRRCGARGCQPAHSRRRTRCAARVRREPPRHGGKLRGFRAAHRPVARRPPGRVLPRDKDWRAERPRGEGGARTLAHAPRRRPRRPHPTAQPGRGGRVGAGTLARRSTGRAR